MKKIALLLFLVFCPLIKVDAFYCQYSDISYLKKLAANINASYTYQEVDGKAIFQITLVNLQPDLYIADTITNQNHYYTNSEITLNNYNSGQTITYKVYTTKQYCEDQLLATIRVTLPTYNPFYKDEICSNALEYELCNRWSSHKLDHESFVNKVKQYKDSLIEKPLPPKEEEIPDNSIMQVIINILLEFYYIPLALVILGSGIGIYVINKKSDIYH